ncbi:MAG: C-terminal helicase domain-containing protein, partial [Clostridia bacterium]|nr:C-terminal helicase domain-containing protein [Clostridia bacterium]
DKLMEEFKGVAVKIDGSTPMNNRQANVDSFQNDPKVRLFIGNIKAAGVGITLTAASNVAFLELPWTPGELDQAEDRCHRIGQKNAVNIWYLLAEHSIEEDLAKTIDGKRKVLDAVLDGKENTQEGMLSFLIDNLSQ